MGHTKARIEKGKNFSGMVDVYRPRKVGFIKDIAIQCNITLIRAPGETPEDRFRYFEGKILQQLVDMYKQQILLFCDFRDYKRLRHLLAESRIVPFSSIDEFDAESPGQLAGAKSRFKKGHTHLFLYSDRLHFFKRTTIKGVRHVIFYGLPLHPHHVSEIENMMTKANEKKKQKSHKLESVAVIY